MEEPDRIPGERRAEEEAEAAAAEASRIGGTTGDEDVAPAERPLREGGEGEAEGFEVAEEDLVEHASHGDPGEVPDPLTDEPEDGRATADYGEADHEGKAPEE